MNGPVSLTQNSENRSSFWKDVANFHDLSLFTDLELVGSLKGCRILCHQLVLASVSKTFRVILRKNFRALNDSLTSVMIPDADFEEIRAFISDLYRFMRNESDVLNYSQNIQDLFQISTQFDPSPEPIPETIEVKVEPKFEYETTSDQDQPWDQDEEKYGEDFWTIDQDDEEKPLSRKRGRKSLEGGRKKRIRYPEVVRTFDDVAEVSDIKDRKVIYDQMTQANTDLEVNLLPESLDYNLHMTKHQLDSVWFLSLLGITSDFHAKPLAWSFPEPEDLSIQFDSVFQAYQHLFGFSNADIGYQGLMYSRQGLQKRNRNIKVRHELRRKYAKCSNDEMKSLVTQKTVVEAMKRFPMKENSSFSPKTYALKLKHDVSIDDMVGVLLLSWDKETKGISCRVLKTNEDERDERASQFVKVLFDIWTLDRQLRIPKCEYLCQRYDELIVPMETFRVYQDFQMDVDRTQRNEILQKTKQCLDCGKVFECVTVKQDSYFLKHRRMHYYNNFTCDCVYDASSRRLKIDHIKLFHSEGKYSQCEFCDHVTYNHLMANHVCNSADKANLVKNEHKKIRIPRDRKPKLDGEKVQKNVGGFYCCSQQFEAVDEVNSHILSAHPNEKYVRCDQCNFLGEVETVIHHKVKSHLKKQSGMPCVCEVCGKSLPTSQALANHKMIHRNYKCDICGEECVGPSALATHKKHSHSINKHQSLPCEVCGKEFPRKAQLKIHFIRKHMEDKDMPFQCALCGRGFPRKYDLSSHEMKAHIKTRPYKCRHGCGADYNDISSRNSHEIKKHGERFPNENPFHQKNNPFPSATR